MSRQQVILYFEFGLLLAFHAWMLVVAGRWMLSWL
jgi:hypothetical protein